MKEVRFAIKKSSAKARPASRKIVSASGRQLTQVTTASPKALLTDVRELILATREGVARIVNAGLVTLYWEIGTRIRKEILKEKRAEYGERIVHALRAQLGWTHFALLLPLGGDALKRDFTAIMRGVTETFLKMRLATNVQMDLD